MFITEKGLTVPAVSEAQMREIDRIAVDEFHLEILQMMENAGRNLAHLTLDTLKSGDQVLIFAGSGGNGGGGITCARHLYNRGIDVRLALTKPASGYSGAAKHQLSILSRSTINIYQPDEVKSAIKSADLFIDALIGYSLTGAPHGAIANFIQQINKSGKPIISLDLPSGVNATDGTSPGEFVRADKTLTLALPKFGLKNSASGEIFLGDIGIPPEVYHQLKIDYLPLFDKQFILKLNLN